MKVLGRDEEDDFELSSGRRFYANMKCIGISPDLETVFYGSDGCIQIEQGCWDNAAPAWTVSERLDLADYMINLWQIWRTKQEENL